MCHIEKGFSVLFDTVGAKKNVVASQIKRRDYFAPVGATRALPKPCDLFEKRSIKNFHSVEVIRLSEGETKALVSFGCYSL